MDNYRLEDKDIAFIRESNRIENIYRDPSRAEIDEFHRFRTLELITIRDCELFVKTYANAKLRMNYGMDVRVRNYSPPSGGPNIINTFNHLLDAQHKLLLSPYHFHIEFQKLHPFMDGNGRLGRMLWLWQMEENNLNSDLGFLHTFYYQTLQNN